MKGVRECRAWGRQGLGTWACRGEQGGRLWCLEGLVPGPWGWMEGVKVVKVCEALSVFPQECGLAGDLKALNRDAL